MNRLFWTLVAVDAVLFLALLAATLVQPRSPDGGREMALTFSLFLPGLVVGLAVLLYIYAAAPAWRGLALVIVAGPGLLLAGARLRGAWIDHLVHENAAGRGYFHGARMKKMGAAVVQGDTSALGTLTADQANTPGSRGVTLLSLAIDQAFESGASDRTLAVVRTLLAAGAKPEAGLEVATKIPDPAYLKALLDAGADPNFQRDGNPVVFEWLGVLPADNLLLLTDHGLDINQTNSLGAPLLVAAAEHDRWDLVNLLLDRKADPGRRDRHGRAVGDVVVDRISSAASYGRPVSPELERIRARLSGDSMAP